MTKSLTINGEAITIRPLTRADLPAVARFAAALPPHDLLFLSRDLQHARVIDAWMASVDAGDIESLVAITDDGTVMATTATVRDPLSWSAHVAELRLLVAPEARGQGLGRVLLEACIQLAVDGGATKLVARMTPDQTGAITMFEETGFRGEALLRDHVRGRDGEYHDLAILSFFPERAAGQALAFG